MTKLRVVGRAVFTLVAVSLLSACGAQTSTPSSAVPSSSPSGSTASSLEPTTGGQVIVVINADPPSLNSLVNQVAQTWQATSPIFDRLVAYDEDFNMLPQLARTWIINDDATRWEFHLAENAMWHDGQPVTSADVKFTVETGIANATKVKSVFGALASIETPDASTVVFNFTSPAATLTAVLGDPLLSILPEHIYGGSGALKDNPANLSPIGSGPYQFKEWVRGEKIVLERNKAYWQAGLPRLDQVVFTIIPDNPQSTRAVEAGEADFFPQNLTAADAVRLKGASGVVVSDKDITHSLVVAPLNLRRERFQDQRVREAMSLAADRDRMVEQVTLGLGVAARGQIASGYWPFDTTLPVITRDLDRANRLLDEAGLARDANGTRFTVKLQYVSGQTAYGQVAEILRENWADVGINVDIVAGELTTTLEAIFTTHDFDVAVIGTFVSIEPADPMTQYFGTGSIDKGFFNNAPGYSNPDVDRLLSEAKQTPDRDERAALYAQIQQLMAKDLPAIPLVEDRKLSVYRSEWQDLFPDPDVRYVNFASTWKP